MKTMLALFISCLSITAKAQTESSTLEGVGRLKVGKTTLSVIPELEAELKTKLKRATTQERIWQTGGKAELLELVPDTVSRFSGPLDASPCLSAKVYFIPKYTVSGVELKRLTLTFWQDKLISLQCDGTAQLLDALKAKYGEGKLEEREEDVPCVFTYTGNKVNYKSKTYTHSWDSEALKAYFTLSNGYDTHCKPQTVTFFLVQDEAARKSLSTCERASRDRREAAQTKKKKAALSDF